MLEAFFKLPESLSALHQLSLHFWSQLLKELEFLNHKVEIMLKSLLYVFFDIVV